MSRFRYPVDTDQFQQIREDGKVYVDKTDLMFDLVDRYKYVFLARPRRFGKSLLCNTFKAYALLKKNYDGYHFSPNSEDVYAPFSLLNALDGNNTNYYWFESGHNDLADRAFASFPGFQPS